MFEKWIGEKTEKSSPSVLARHRNRSGVVELVGREPLMFAKVENGVTKSCQNLRRKNAGMKNAILAWFFFILLSTIACCSRESRSAWQSFWKTAEREEEEIFLSLWDFFSKVGVRNPVFRGEFHFFGRGKTNFFCEGGGVTSKMARQWPSWGIYKHDPPVFWRKRRLLYSEKGGQIKTFSWGGQHVT